MSMQNLEELMVDKLKDVHDAERRITHALPKMIKAASSEELSTAFQDHLKVTEEHIARLESILETLGKAPGRKTCYGMKGLLEEGQELMEKEAPESVKDAGLIAAAQAVEHYEMAAYGCLKTWAELLNLRDEAEMLDQTLHEEKEADEKLTELASSLNAQAVEAIEGYSSHSVGTRRSTGNGARSSNRPSR